MAAFNFRLDAGQQNRHDPDLILHARLADIEATSGYFRLSAK